LGGRLKNMVAAINQHKHVSQRHRCSPQKPLTRPRFWPWTGTSRQPDDARSRFCGDGEGLGYGGS
jgi:hypothetical protein